MKIAIIGLGEAGSHFANDLIDMGIAVSGWDPDLQRTLHPDVRFAADNPDAIQGADVIFSVNYASESKAIAHEVFPHLAPGQVYCEMNTSSPATKQEIEILLKPAEIHFADVAIMAPVPPHGIRVPLLASGRGAPQLARLLAPYALNLTVIDAGTGEAAARKLLRSIVYKGVAAVICEAVEAGRHFGLERYIRSQIHAILSEDDALIDRFIQGSQTHAARRVHEMEAVIDMLEEAGLSHAVSTGALKNLMRYVS